MSMRSWCFDAVYDSSTQTYDRVYGSANIREAVSYIIGNGIHKDVDNCLKVTASSGMTVSVAAGACWINGALGVLDAAQSVTIATPAASTVYIVARFSTNSDKRCIEVTSDTSHYAGTAGSSSVRDLVLARIDIPSGASSILSSMITDTRADTTLCGEVTGVLSQAEDLQDQITVIDNLVSGHSSSISTLLSHANSSSNPHGVTSSQIGLGNVANVLQYSKSNPPMCGKINYTGTSKTVSLFTGVTCAIVGVRYNYSSSYLVPQYYQTMIFASDNVKTLIRQSSSGNQSIYAQISGSNLVITSDSTYSDSGWYVDYIAF